MKGRLVPIEYASVLKKILDTESVVVNPGGYLVAIDPMNDDPGTITIDLTPEEFKAVQRVERVRTALATPTREDPYPGATGGDL